MENIAKSLSVHYRCPLWPTVMLWVRFSVFWQVSFTWFHYHFNQMKFQLFVFLFFFLLFLMCNMNVIGRTAAFRCIWEMRSELSLHMKQPKYDYKYEQNHQSISYSMWSTGLNWLSLCLMTEASALHPTFFQSIMQFLFPCCYDCVRQFLALEKAAASQGIKIKGEKIYTNHLSTLIIMALATSGHWRTYNLVSIMQFEVFYVLHGSRLQFKYQWPWKICTYV